MEELFDWAGAEEAALRLDLDVPSQVLWARREPLPVTPDPYHLLPLPHPLPPTPAPRGKGMAGPWNLPPLEEVRRQGAEDALFYWPDGTLAETAIAAIALERDGDLLLPPPGGRVTSLGERLLLPAWAEARHLRIRQTSIPWTEAQAGRIWCVNALRGVWRAELHLPARDADSNL